MTNKISTEEKNNAVKRIENILNEFDQALKTAEKVYEDAIKKGNIQLQREIQKKIDHIKKEEASIQNILVGIKAIC
jgi:hypothetical protein